MSRHNTPSVEALVAEPPEESAADLAVSDLIEPNVGRVVVKVKTLPDRSKTGLYLAPAMRELEASYRPTQGEVVAVASPEEEWKDESGEVWKPLYNVGDMVLFGKYSGVQVKYRDLTLIILNESDILARVKDPEAKLKVRD